jgi:hypothetical protein
VAHPQIAAFARLAEGNAKPTRAIAGQNTRITRTIHDLAYDPVHDEIVVPQLHAQALMTFRGDANGDVQPIRIIMGARTQLKSPIRLGLDPVHEEIFVPLGDRVLVFARQAQGNVAPIRILMGPDTQLGAGALVVDPVHDLLITSGVPETGGGEGDRVGQLLIFNRTDNGNAKPRAVIRGPKARISGSALLEVYPPRGLILAAVRGRGRSSIDNYVGVWSIDDHGDVAPRWTIGGPNGMLRQVRGVTVDAKHKTVIVSDKFLNAVLTYEFPEIF